MSKPAKNTLKVIVATFMPLAVVTVVRGQDLKAVQVQLPSPPTTDNSRDVMRLLLTQHRLVILGEVEEVFRGIGREARTHFSWIAGSELSKS